MLGANDRELKKTAPALRVATGQEGEKKTNKELQDDVYLFKNSEVNKDSMGKKEQKKGLMIGERGEGRKRTVQILRLVDYYM